MADWKSTLKKVATDLGLGASNESKKKRGIDVSRWFPQKTDRVPVAVSKLVSASTPRSAVVNPAPPPDAHGPVVRSKAIPALPPTSIATKGPARSASALAATSLATNRSRRIEGVRSRPQQPTKRSVPSGNIVSSEGLLQFPDISQLAIRFPDCHARPEWFNASPPVEEFATAGERICVLGLDFGTAFTKACIGVRGKHYFVHWDECINYPQTYLLPTFITELEDGKCILGSAPGGAGVVHSGLKMALLTSPTDERRTRTVAFFALAMRYARTWMWRKHREVIAGFKLTWLINIGLPTTHWDDEEPASDLFRVIALAGWRLSFSSMPISIETARAELNTVEAECQASPITANQELEIVETFPEFGAQIHSYRTASQSRKDLHLLVDIGAGTVDIVTFHIGEDKDDELNAIMDSLVEIAGTHVLLHLRSQAAGLTKSSWDDSDTRLTSDQFEKLHHLPPGTLKANENQFTELLGRRIREVLSKTKTGRYASSPNWLDLPYFLVGGGRDVNVYRNAPDEGVRNLLVRYSPMRFPLPDKASLELAGLPEGDFHRVSVAHGLSFDPLNIKRTCRKRESEDLYQRETSRPKFSEGFVDKSQV